MEDLPLPMTPSENEKPSIEEAFFSSEHAKRDRHLSQKQKLRWADALLACLPDSPGYRIACTRESRLAEQAMLNQFVDDWLTETAESPHNPGPQSR